MEWTEKKVFGLVHTQSKTAFTKVLHTSEGLDMEFHTYFNQHQHLVNVEETSNNY